MRNEPGDFLSFEDSDVLEALATKSNVVSEILVSWFHNDDPWLRLAAARTLADSESIDVLFSLLDVENEDVRLQAARFLIDLGKATVKVVASLRSLILSTNLIARRYSACALWARIGPIDDDVVSMIRSWLNEEELDYNAIRLLEGLGKLDVSLVVLLRAWLVGNRRHLRSEAERVLLEIAKANPTVEATFWSWLTADDRSLRLSSARMLCRLTQRDTEVHETLIGILSPDSTAIRLWRKAYSGVRLEEEEVLELEGMLSTFEGDDDVCQATRAFLFETLFVRPTSAIDIPA